MKYYMQRNPGGYPINLDVKPFSLQARPRVLFPVVG